MKIYKSKRVSQVVYIEPIDSLQIIQENLFLMTRSSIIVLQVVYKNWKDSFTSQTGFKNIQVRYQEPQLLLYADEKIFIAQNEIDQTINFILKLQQNIYPKVPTLYQFTVMKSLHALSQEKLQGEFERREMDGQIARVDN